MMHVAAKYTGIWREFRRCDVRIVYVGVKLMNMYEYSKSLTTWESIVSFTKIIISTQQSVGVVVLVSSRNSFR